MTATPPHDPGNEPGEPLRWERDSRKEDFEAHRHRMMDRLDAWAAEQSRAPLTNVLEGAGVERRPGETWASYIVPKGWADVTPPEPRCPWCQRPADSDATCQDCTDARDGDPDPAGITAWWQDAAPITRRLYLNAAHGTDPWTGKPCRIRYQSVTAGEEGVQVTHTWRPLVPRSSWDLRPAP